MEPTDRSIPPEMITTVAPIAMIAKKLASVAVWTSVYEFQKLFTRSPVRRSGCEPASKVRIRVTSTTTSTSPVSCEPSSLRAMVRKLLGSQETGLVLVVVLVTLILTLLAGSHPDRRTGDLVNNFWNSYTLVQTATDASFFAIMAIGATVVIISGGIDLSVGSIYALAGVTMALLLRALGP